MTSIASAKKWLETSLKNEYIRFYSYDSLIDRDCIGHGAFGVVFKATVATSGITVAYKMIKYSDEDEFFKCFVNELKIHRKVDDHPNIIRFLGVSKDVKGRYLMVFDYANNGSLREYLSTSSIKLDWPAKSQLGLDIVNGLRYIHSAGILHKDLSSNNVLIHGKTAKITDFGTSEKLLLQKTCSDHQGTCAYLDPKCFDSNGGKRDEKSDIFSFGIILWEISSGVYPCSEFENMSDIQIYRLNGGRHEAVPGTPEEYKKLYSECWDIDSEKRPNSEQCYHRLKNVIGTLNELPKCDTNQDDKVEVEKDHDHSLSNELSSLYNELHINGKYTEQIANYIKVWLMQNKDKQESSLATLKAHTNCGQCFLLIGFFYAYGIETETDLEQAIQWYQQSVNTGNAAAQCSLGICYDKGMGVEKNIQKAVELYQKAAEQGYASAQYNLGLCYMNGTGVEENVQKAVELYHKAAEQGHARAQNNLGLCYMNRIGVEKNIQTAVELYQKAAERGYARAQCNLGICYECGTGMEKNIKKAVKLYKKAAEQGYARAQCNLGICYECGTGVKKNVQKAVKLYQNAVEQKYFVAQCNLGVCYEYGIGVEKDIQKAIELYRKAAGQGYGRAQYNLGVCYEHGIGVEKNVQIAVELYHKAAEQGYAKAQYNLGVYYEQGTRVEKDIEKAIELYQRAAEQGYAGAQCSLGVFYKNGTGVETNIRKAVKLFQKAAKQGYARAQFNLGVCYEHGIGVESDIQKVIELYQKAAEQGYAKAQFNLGVCYKNGMGVEKNFDKAMELYQKAADQGYARAQITLKRMEFSSIGGL